MQYGAGMRLSEIAATACKTFPQMPVALALQKLCLCIGPTLDDQLAGGRVVLLGPRN